MTLQQAVEQQFYEEPTKRLVRAPNRGGWIDVHFVYNHTLRKLMVRSWVVRLGQGMELTEHVAPFQASPHEDWILV